MFDVHAFKRLCLSELSYRGAFKYNRICGFTKQQIVNIIQYPERYSSHIIRLSQYMYLKSGYYKRLIDYFVNSAIVNWTVDLELKTMKVFAPDEKMSKTIRSNYIKYIAQVNRFKIDNRVTDIFHKIFLEDACFGFITENNTDTSIYFIDPQYAEIKRIVNGNVCEFAVNRSLLSAEYLESLPVELQELIERSKEVSPNNMVIIPYENSFCIKYHNDFSFIYPPYFNLIAEILNIDDIKDLVKAKSEADAYKLFYFKIPLNDDGQISIGDELITPFTTMAREILPDRFGVIPSPMDLQLLESKSTVNDDTNKVEQAVENYYTEAGVSKALISSASSGSELKLSMKVDSSDIYRIYRQIESWVDLQMKLKGYIYNDYQFVYRILPTTIYDVNDYIDLQLKLAQASIDNKSMLASSNGINPAKLIGNSILEHNILGDIFNTWQPLKSSYTTSNDGSDGGAPAKDETEISEVTEATRANGGNDPDNRI